MKYDTLKALVNAKVYENTEQRITGGDMNTVLQSAIASLGAHYQMGGLVSPNDQITVGDEPVVFLATTPGTYTYFGGLVVADGEVALLVWSGTAWSKQTPDIATRTAVSQLGQEIIRTNYETGQYLADNISNTGYVEFDYIFIPGYSYTIVNSSESAGNLSARERSASGVTVEDIISNLTPGAFHIYTPTVSGKILAVTIQGGGKFSIYAANYQIPQLLDFEKTQLDINKTLDYNVANSYYKSRNSYINSSIQFADSGSWLTRIYNAQHIKSIKRLVSYTNNQNFCAIVGYSDAELTNVVFYKQFLTGAGTEYVLENFEIPANVKYIAIPTRIAISENYTLIVTASDTFQIIKDLQIEPIKTAISELEDASFVGSPYGADAAKVFSHIENSNDFTIVGDELWAARSLDNSTVIYIYKIQGDNLVLSRSITTDFGHLNTLDYNPENDCLIFGNGANDFSTENNWFAIVKNPRALGSTASLANDALVIPVNIGYKVQAVWGGSNLGQNNIAILMSNGAANIYVIALEKTNNEFNGNFVVLESITPDESFPVNGADYFDGYLYWGTPNYQYVRMRLGDNKVERFKRFYTDGVTLLEGSTQGLCLNNKFLWEFINVSGQTVNYLIKRYR